MAIFGSRLVCVTILSSGHVIHRKSYTTVNVLGGTLVAVPVVPTEKAVCATLVRVGILLGEDANLD
jgi:hypothetical protein